MVAVVWTLVAVIIAGMAGFFFDARSERRSLKAAIEKLGSDLNARIDKTSSDMNTRIDQTNTDMNAHFDQVNARIDQVIMNMATKEDVTELRADIHRVEDKLDEHLHQHGPTATRQTA